MKQCPQCGLWNYPQSPVCQRCGTVLPEIPVPGPPQVPPVPPMPAGPQQLPSPPGPPPSRPLPPGPVFIRQQGTFTWRDIFTVLGFVSAVTGYFYASVLLLPLGLIASIVGFRSIRNRGLAVAGVVISAIGILLKVMLILQQASLLPDWFTNGIW